MALHEYLLLHGLVDEFIADEGFSFMAMHTSWHVFHSAHIQCFIGTCNICTMLLFVMRIEYQAFCCRNMIISALFVCLLFIFRVSFQIQGTYSLSSSCMAINPLTNGRFLIFIFADGYYFKSTKNLMDVYKTGEDMKIRSKLGCFMLCANAGEQSCVAVKYTSWNKMCTMLVNQINDYYSVTDVDELNQGTFYLSEKVGIYITLAEKHMESSL